MAMVYRATDLELQRTVAIKLLRRDFSRDDEFRHRFRQEARAAAGLSHPNIVTVYDFGLDADRLFIVMENVPGTDLKTLMQRRGRFNIDEALQLTIQACAGIGFAHRAGLIHCDVKPQNMLVTPDWRLKVTDFGIARAMSTIHPGEHSDVVWGSPQYFSPEQAAGGPPLPASDVYSIGVVLFEMLTGQLPFNAESPQELARQHREMLPPSPRRYNPQIPPQLEQVMLKVLAKEPAARYRTADQLGRVLVSFSQQSGAATVVNPAVVGSLPNQAEPMKAAQPAPPVAARSVPQPAAVRTKNPPTAARRQPMPPPEDNPLDVDWFTWFLVLAALVAVGGLVPFWMWVYYMVIPPL